MIHGEKPGRWGAAKLLATTITGVRSIVQIPELYTVCILQHPFFCYKMYRQEWYGIYCDKLSGGRGKG